MLKTIWSDPVWSKVISTAIIATFGGCITYATNIWPSANVFLNSASTVPNWLLCLALPVSGGVFLVGNLVGKTSSGRVGPNSALGASAPQIEITHRATAPYEVSDIQHQHVLSTVRIGLTNPGGAALSNCKVYVEKIAPEPPLPGGLPILLDGAGFTLRHDDPEKLVDIAALWDHVGKFRFSAPVGGTFAEALGYIDANTSRTIIIRVVAVECQRSASFRLWIDGAKAMHLEFIGYVH